jgi:hypothetical protein
MGKNRTKHRVIFGVLACACILLILLWLYYFIAPQYVFMPIKFDSTAWQRSPSEFSLDSTRLRMVDDLLATHLRLGMRRDGVVELLGEPDDTPYFDHYDLVYHLGQERSLIGIDSEWLVIRLDDSRHVIELQVLRD